MIEYFGRKYDVVEVEEFDDLDGGEVYATVRLREQNYRPPVRAKLVVAVKSYRSSWFVYLRQNGRDTLVSEFKPLDALTSSGLAFPNPRFQAMALVNEIKRLNCGNVEVVWE